MTTKPDNEDPVPGYGDYLEAILLNFISSQSTADETITAQKAPTLLRDDKCAALVKYEPGTIDYSLSAKIKPDEGSSDRVNVEHDIALLPTVTKQNAKVKEEIVNDSFPQSCNALPGTLVLSTEKVVCRLIFKNIFPNLNLWLVPGPRSSCAEDR
jgi:hypothetical protein